VPKTLSRAGGRPAGAIVGFTNFLLGLWDGEQPRAVVVAWDTLEAPTYRHDAFAGYQAGRVFDDALLEQLSLLRELVEALGFRAARAPGFEADDFLAACARAEEAQGGSCLVATSDRDAFQLVSDRTLVIRPLKGVSVLERVGPDDVVAQYGVQPSQVPDYIALKGDSSDRIPGAKGVGPKTAALLLAQYGNLDAVLEAGRFERQAEELRLYRRIATLDASAPLPSLSDQTPTWAEASALLTGWGMGGVAERVAARVDR
jgi:DNA polymerase-1